MFNRDNLELVEERLRAQRITEELAADRRREEVEGKNPRLRALGETLRNFGVRVLEESMRGSENLSARIEALRAEHRQVQAEYALLLQEMGYPKDYTQIKTACKKCSDTGYFEGKMCECLKKAAVLEGYRTSGIGALLQKQTFENFDLSFYSDALLPEKNYSARDVMKEIFGYCRDYAENFSLSSPSLLFIGGTGLGKTHLSSAIAGKAIEKAFDVVYESAPQVAAIFEKERFESEEEAEGTRRLLEAELLILDDLGTEPSSKVSASAVYRLINHRVAVKGLPTIISTNLTYRQLEKQYDSAILSRLLGEFSVKFFQGEDVRMAKLQRK